MLPQKRRVLTGIEQIQRAMTEQVLIVKEVHRERQRPLESRRNSGEGVVASKTDANAGVRVSVEAGKRTSQELPMKWRGPPS